MAQNKPNIGDNRRNISEEKLQKLVDHIKPKMEKIEDSTSHETALKQLIKTFYDEFIDENITKKFVNKITENKNKDLQKYFKSLIEEIYGTGFCLDGSLKDLREYNENFNEEDIEILEDVIKKKKEYEYINEKTGSETSIIINRQEKKVLKEFIKIVNDKNYSKHHTVIKACPEKVEIYESPLTNEPRTFKIKWITTLNKKFETGGELGGGNIKEIEEQIENGGYCINPSHFRGVIATVIEAFLSRGLATIKRDVEYPGFFYDKRDNKVINIKYDIEKPSVRKLEEAVDILEKLVKYFEGSEDKLATCLKWGWMSPFNYIKKEKGEFLPWLVLEGSAGTGKTILGHIILLLWNEITESNDISGANFDTVARVGNRISQSTFPILVNEPQGTFQNLQVVDMLKSAIERTTSRGKYINNQYRNIPSLAPLIFTTNRSPPNMASFVRRMHKISFTYDERKSEEEKKNFEEEFRLNNSKNSMLNKLKNISYFFFDEIRNDPKLLYEDWAIGANMILNRLYTDLYKDMPKWLKSHVKNFGLEEHDENTRTIIKSFMIDEINRKANKVTVYNENGYKINKEKLSIDEDDGLINFKDRVWNVVNNRLLSWAVIKTINNENYVCITSNFKNELCEKRDICESMRSFAGLLRWKYQSIWLEGTNSSVKMIKVDFDEFTRFISN